MAIKKGTKAWKQEIIRTYYGVNRKTFDVENVTETRGGTLTKWMKDGMPLTSATRPGSPTRSEIVTVFGLTDIIEVSPQFEDQQSTKQRVDDLRAKAAKLKQEREAQ